MNRLVLAGVLVALAVAAIAFAGDMVLVGYAAIGVGGACCGVARGWPVCR